MASLKDLRVRINSVRQTQKITSAMKLVAASKLRRAQEAAEAARPFSERMERMVGSLAEIMGEGAFSGKDPSKVDRSAAYAARYLAKNVVAANLASRCTIQLAYAIGVAHPLAVYVDTHGTGQIDEARLAEALNSVMDLSPRGIGEHLDLARPIFERTAAYGHFGRDPEADGGFSWERTDLVDPLLSAVG